MKKIILCLPCIVLGMAVADEASDIRRQQWEREYQNRQQQDADVLRQEQNRQRDEAEYRRQQQERQRLDAEQRRREEDRRRYR
jgi:hypothetical protein